MIGSVRGTVLARVPPAELVVEVGGVGYRTVVTPTTFVAAGDPGAEVLLHTHLHVREDALTLYGFLTHDERLCFEAMLGAHGVGPALAMAILAVHRPDALRRVLADGDADALCMVPGVGKKTAARLLIELQARLDLPELDVAGAAGGVRAEVREALAQLGYEPDEVREALRGLPDGADPQTALREALQRLGTR